MFARHLGLVASMFEEGISLIDETVPLREEVKLLTPVVFNRLLTREGPEVARREAYSLLLAWLYQSPHVTCVNHRRALFKMLAPLLRYHHMTVDFVANIVSQCPLMQNSSLLPSVMYAAFSQREASPGVLQQDHVARGTRSRGMAPSLASWEVNASFTLEVAALHLKESIEKWCGIVAGFPAGFQLQRRQDKGTDTLAAYLVIDVPVPTPSDTLAGAPTPGVGLTIDMVLSPDVRRSIFPFFTDIILTNISCKIMPHSVIQPEHHAYVYQLRRPFTSSRTPSGKEAVPG